LHVAGGITVNYEGSSVIRERGGKEGGDERFRYVVGPASYLLQEGIFYEIWKATNNLVGICQAFEAHNPA